MADSAKYHVSVITVCFNSASTIGRTIDSVQGAIGPWRIQHCIVDGGSTDGTLELVERRLRPGDKFLTEPDDGISDAFNKGVRMAEGAYIQVLNSDDWADANFWNTMLGVSEGCSLPMIHSDAVHFEDGEAFRVVTGSQDYRRHLDLGMKGIGHACMLTRRDLFLEVGLFSPHLHYAMDLDWLQRAHDLGYTSRYVPGARINFAVGGRSFSDGGVVVESTQLARARQVSKWRILRMRATKRVRLRSHPLLTRARRMWSSALRTFERTAGRTR